MSKQIQRTVTARPAERTVAGRRPAVKTGKKTITWNFPLNRKNFLFLAIGVGIIILGYILMATGITDTPAFPGSKWDNPFAVDVAPVLLVIGYCVVIPYAIIKYFGKKEADSDNE
jgi:hypothetical protein